MNKIKNLCKRKKVALTACMRKFIIILNTMIKNKTSLIKKVAYVHCCPTAVA